jgi:hypothetical protein
MAIAPEHGIIPKDLTKTIQVIGAGMPRTGTTSFAKALEKLLDGPVCHGSSAIIMREEGMICLLNQAACIPYPKHICILYQLYLSFSSPHLPPANPTSVGQKNGFQSSVSSPAKTTPL